MARRKTVPITEIRALANRVLAASDPEMTQARLATASMYEHLSMAANDYHGYNDIVAIWSGEPGKSTYVEDATCRRQYLGEMTGPDAQPAEDAIKRYREARDTDPELLRRQELADASARPSNGDTETTCHCGSEYKGWDHCQRCGCEQYESLSCDLIPRIESRQVGIGDGHGWLVYYRGDWYVISTGDLGSGPETCAFRAYEDGIVRDWDNVAGGNGSDKAAVLRELMARPVDDQGRVMSIRDEYVAAELEAEERERRAAAGDDQAQDAQHEADQRHADKAAEHAAAYQAAGVHPVAAERLAEREAAIDEHLAQHEACCDQCSPPAVSQATLDEVARVAREYPDGVHTCAELQALEPGRRQCTCGRCPERTETP